jgi:hypothetical protein
MASTKISELKITRQSRDVPSSLSFNNGRLSHTIVSGSFSGSASRRNCSAIRKQSLGSQHRGRRCVLRSGGHYLVVVDGVSLSAGLPAPSRPRPRNVKPPVPSARLALRALLKRRQLYCRRRGRTRAKVRGGRAGHRHVELSRQLKDWGIWMRSSVASDRLPAAGACRGLW